MEGIGGACRARKQMWNTKFKVTLREPLLKAARNV